MDIPRDCRDYVTQRLDGYGPWAMEDFATKPELNATFIETGMPFTVKEWDPEIAMDILEGKRKPPGEEEVGDTDDGAAIELDEICQYTPEAIRAKEEGKKVLAIYTPGRSNGSMSYIFPELRLCVSGYTLPLEDSRQEENTGMDSTGPALDCRGYITTSKAGISRQMESARKLVNGYVERFDIVLPSGGDPYYLEQDVEVRRKTLLDIVAQYEKIGKIYEQLGITSRDSF
jgi:glyoxylase-like metal-dependent hydrolase (beta-lactamase superfamily II)